MIRRLTRYKDPWSNQGIDEKPCYNEKYPYEAIKAPEGHDPVIEEVQEGFFITERTLKACYIAGMLYQSQGGDFKFNDWLKHVLNKEQNGDS